MASQINRRIFIHSALALAASGCASARSATTAATTSVATDAAAAAAAGDGLFGIATSASSSRHLDWLGTMRSAGMGWIRGFDTNNVTASLDAAEAAGFQTTGILQMGDRFPSDNLPAWEAHCESLVRAAAGRVRYWEVWNEPPNWSSDKTPEAYAKIVASAYNVVKRVDSSLQVAICGSSVNLNFIEQAIRAGAANCFDYITLHPYETMDLLVRGFDGQFMGIAATTRRMLQACNPAKAGVPIIFTEIGAPVQGDVTPALQADLLVKSQVLSAAQGITRVHWFEGVDGDSGPFGLIDSVGRQRPSYIAMSTLADILGVQPSDTGGAYIGDGQPGFVFDSTEGVALVAWARPGAPLTLNFKKPKTWIDPRNGVRQSSTSIALGTSPIIVVGLPKGLASKAAAHREEPFPWQGVYAGASSVSFVAGESPTGLHPVADDAAASGYDRRAYPALNITVDPNFLIHDTVPLRVTAEVRRNTLANAGFNLRYESKTGYRATGAWTTVPEGDGWHELSWDIDDASFVGKWGYHLSLDSDSTLFSNYSLRRMTIARR